MAQRSQGAWRLLAAAWLATIGAVILSVVITIGVIWGAIDIVWQIISGRNDLSERSRPAQVVGGTIVWYYKQLVFVVLGSDWGDEMFYPWPRGSEHNKVMA